MPKGSRMRIIHVTASTFFGGPERQMLGLGHALKETYQSSYISFKEHGQSAAFYEQAQAAGFASFILHNDTPHFSAAIQELKCLVKQQRGQVMITHGYKANLLGRLVARQLGIPIIAVARGWTGQNLKVRCYETIDRIHLRCMDAVVCVSHGQARKVRRAGVATRKIRIIRNAARVQGFANPRPEFRTRLRELAGAGADDLVVMAAGRLSPEKGYHILIEAAAKARALDRRLRFVLFGDGPEKERLTRLIAQHSLNEVFHLPGFRDDLDIWMPWCDIFVLPSFTEGLPNVVLEASSAGVAVIATAVGGTPEVIRDGVTGCLIPSGDVAALANSIRTLARDAELRQTLGQSARQFMLERYSFAGQAEAYRQLFAQLRKDKSIASS